MSDHLLFVYGTFMNKSLLDRVLGHDAGNMHEIELPGFKKVCGSFSKRRPMQATAKSTYCDIVQSEGESVSGKLAVLSDDDLRKTDAWENEYRRIPVEIMGQPGFAYGMKPEELEKLKPV